ncbi:hypothetical protein KIN20_009834 [Parelaphostrongylus tenuis]|uniref:Uncharacterized protein n=1 Tax=Parelaphostrongylus tenuis TaxID=148309 RepID=A0AAD5M8Q1_PARTN|nr:hypothetical protein KIN20_009834 [Parelaphostrongylus tenuis]
MDKKEVTLIAIVHGSSIDPVKGNFQPNVSYNKRKGYAQLTRPDGCTRLTHQEDKQMEHSPILPFGRRSMYARRLSGLQRAPDSKPRFGDNRSA